MNVILLQKVNKLGGLGDTVSVKPGFGRNYLIPNKIAVPATAANVANFEQKRAELEKEQTAVIAVAQGRSDKVNEGTVTIAHRAGEEGKLFGSVGTVDIAAAVTEQLGTEIEKREVLLPEGALRNLGEYDIALQLHSDIKTIVKVVVIEETE